jgi:amino acid efflux transporter
MQTLQKNLGFAQGLALYLAAVLGTGILIVPVLALEEGGAASLVAWAFLGLLGLALAWTFASAGAQLPDAGGIQAMIGRVYGPTMESLTKFLVFCSVPAGAVAVAYIFALHISAALRLSDSAVPYLAIASWLIVAMANLLGLRVSAAAQLVLSGLLVGVLGTFVVLLLPRVNTGQFMPFAPHSIGGIGRSALVIFWSFLGWEAIAHLAEEFRDPKRDMLRAAIAAGVLVAVFYFAVAFVLIGAGIFQTHAGASKTTPLIDMAQILFGNSGRIFSGLLAGIVCLSTMNAYMAGLSRLAYSMARNGDLPKILGALNQSGTPRNGILFLLFGNLSALFVQFIFHFELKYFFLVQNLAFLLLYIFGCLSVARLLRGRRSAVIAAYFSAGVCIIILPFARGILIYPVIVAALALLRIYFKKERISYANES